MNKKLCNKIAEVAVKIGVNLQKGQDAVIFISPRQQNLLKALVETCYKNGARKISVEYNNEEITKLKYQYETTQTLTKIDKWEVMKFKQRSEDLPVLIHVEDEDPDAYKNLDLKKINAARAAKMKKIKKYRDKESLYNQWTIIAVPSPSWAKKVFPNVTSKQAEKMLLDAIVKTTRLDNDNPFMEWEKHIENLREKAEYLNNLNLDYLVYTSSNGTNLKLKLQPNHVWLSARSKNLKGIEYCANMPTEEVFTMPKRDGVDGVVCSTKPLSYNGKVIEDFKVYFEKGRIVKVEAKTNQDVLLEAINTDEGSHYLGEVALVEYNSPINQTGILFYNTLFDENAACHLAFGEAYEDTVKGYETMSKEDLKNIGFNESLIHVDFMIGSKDLDIVGYDFNNKAHQIFKNGNWAF